MKKKGDQKLSSAKGLNLFLKAKRRKEKFRSRIAGYERHKLNMKYKAAEKGKIYKVPKKSPFLHEKKLPPKPEYPINIKYLLSIPELFAKNQYNEHNDGHLFLPTCFSLIENYEESFKFLKHLFVILHQNKVDKIILDYKNCQRIDVDASICMDVMLVEFINYINKCRNIGYKDIFSKGINFRTCGVRFSRCFFKHFFENKNFLCLLNNQIKSLPFVKEEFAINKNLC